MTQFEEVNITNIGDDGVAYASMFFDNFSMLLSVLIGIIATILVLRSASKMGGGLFGIVLNYIGIGMLFVSLGAISIILDYWIVGIWINIMNTVCFALGFIFMVIGANKLIKGIMTN